MELQNILIVDDNAANRKVLRVMLEAAGLIVFEAGNGVEALALLERETVDAIISDILMPRMDGYLFCQQVRRSHRHKSIPLIFYTNTYTSPADEKLGLGLGAQCYVRKPASTETILSALQAAVATPITASLISVPEMDLLKEYNGRLVAKLEHRNIELEQRTAELLLQSTALEAAANAILVTDAKGVILWVNRAFTALTGHTEEEVRGKTPRVLKSGIHDRAFYANLWETILSGNTWRGEFINRRKDGSLFHAEHTITPVQSEGGAISHFAGIMDDITHRREIEEELKRRAEALARSNAELARFNRLAVGRELRMVELKQQVNELCQQLGKPQVYDLGGIAGAVPIPAWPAVTGGASALRTN
jgi:PAS domain S-box-containing protein